MRLVGLLVILEAGNLIRRASEHPFGCTRSVRRIEIKMTKRLVGMKASATLEDLVKILETLVREHPRFRLEETGAANYVEQVIATCSMRWHRFGADMIDASRASNSGAEASALAYSDGYYSVRFNNYGEQAALRRAQDAVYAVLLDAAYTHGAILPKFSVVV